MDVKKFIQFQKIRKTQIRLLCPLFSSSRCLKYKSFNLLAISLAELASDTTSSGFASCRLLREATSLSIAISSFLHFSSKARPSFFVMVFWFSSAWSVDDSDVLVVFAVLAVLGYWCSPDEDVDEEAVEIASVALVGLEMSCLGVLLWVTTFSNLILNLLRSPCWCWCWSGGFAFLRGIKIINCKE